MDLFTQLIVALVFFETVTIVIYHQKLKVAKKEVAGRDLNRTRGPGPSRRGGGEIDHPEG